MAGEALNNIAEESFNAAEESLKNNEYSINDQWGQICGQLRLEFGETAFESWLKPLSVGSLDNGVVNM